MRRVQILLLILLPASLMWLSCGNNPGSKTSGIAYRAFITNTVSSGNIAAGTVIVNAETDDRSGISIPTGNSPGMMVVTPNRAQTLVFSGSGTQTSDNQFSIIDNSKEAPASSLILPGTTESFVVSPDSSTAYIAVPTAPVVGQSPGVVEVVALSNGTAVGQVEIPSVHYLSISNNGTRVLGFSDNSNSVAVITPSNIGILNASAVTFVGGFDHPVAAFFTPDDTTAYVLNCGAECGGTQASIQTLDLTNNTAGAPGVVCTPGGNPPCIGTLNLQAGSVALVDGSTMYVAGTPVPPQSCTVGTTQLPCGLLSVVNLNTMNKVEPPPPACPANQDCPAIITDGYHNRIALGPNGQLFIGAHTCTEIYNTAANRGCLSIYNTLTTAVGNAQPGGVVIPPANGDVTGLQPIAKRSTSIKGEAQEVVYVVQGGSVYIYDTTIDALESNPHNPNNPGQIYGLVGNFVDVKTVDF